MQPSVSVSTEKEPLNILEIFGAAAKGGMENYLTNFFKYLPQGKFNVTCICPYESEFTAQLRSWGMEVYITRVEDDPCWKSIQLALELIRMKRIDIIHAHMPKAHVLAGVAGNLSGKPVVATIHGMEITPHELGVALAVDSYLITNNQEAYIQAMAMGIPDRKLYTIKNGVDLDYYSPGYSSQHLRKYLGLDSTVPLIGFVGRFAHEKGPDLFLRVAQYVATDIPEAHFIMVGDGEMKQQLQTLCSSLQLEDRVHFIPWQKDNRPVYAAFDILAHTSRSDGTSLVLSEAMACGCPTVGIGVGGVLEIIENFKSGMIANDWEGVAAHIIHLLKEPHKLNEMGRAGRARVEKYFDAEKNIGETAKIIQQIAYKEMESCVEEKTLATVASIKPKSKVRNIKTIAES